MLLEDEKMVVTTAENGEEAVDIVSQSVPADLILFLWIL